MRILIVGNVIKDVYLGLDERKDIFELDGDGTPWMNLAFDGEDHAFFSRTSVFGGAAVTLDVLKKLGQDATISDAEIEVNKDAKVYRYIFSVGDKIAYFVPAERVKTNFVAPNEPVDWVFVDRSAEFSREMVDKIKSYIGLTRAKLAVFAYTKNCFENVKIDMRSRLSGKKTFCEGEKELVRLANVVFTDGELTEPTRGVICSISDREIRCGSIIRRYKVSRNDLMTHLTSYSIIAATIFGAMLNKANTREALEMAAINVENATLTDSLSLNKLTQLVEERQKADGNLRLIAKTLVTPGRGILAADESGGSIHKKFEEAGILDDAKHRRDYRNLFFTTRNLNKYVNGVILFDETARQKADDGRDFVSYLTAMGIVPGIKVDLGLENFAEPEYASEKWTKGLDDLPERLAEYYEMGARFAKWRAAFEVTLDGVGSDNVTVRTPSDYAILKNCEILAEYAKDCQNAGIVPIVEPEVVHDGYYSIETCAEITTRILNCLFEQLKKNNVNLEGCILKTNMVLAGKKFEVKSTPAEVGEWTARVLKACCPKELAGVVFLSGGQSVEQATENLQAVTNHGPFPFNVTFSYARALQEPALNAWGGNNENAEAAKEAFLSRLVANCKALVKNRL